MVSGIASLRTLSAIINEPNGLLTDQILGAFGPKLRELELSGNLEIFAFGVSGLGIPIFLMNLKLYNIVN